MRLEVLNSGHAFKMKALFTVMRLMSRQKVPDVVKTLTYRPDFFGNPSLRTRQCEWQRVEEAFFKAGIVRQNRGPVFAHLRAQTFQAQVVGQQLLEREPLLRGMPAGQ